MPLSVVSVKQDAKYDVMWGTWYFERKHTLKPKMKNVIEFYEAKDGVRW